MRARALVDGSQAAARFEHGDFIGPTILDELAPEGEIASTDIFGPILSLMHIETTDMRSTFAPKRRSWLSAGRRSGHVSSSIDGL